MRCHIDVLLEADLLPVARGGHESVAGLAGEVEHGIVGPQGVAEQVLGAGRGGAAFQVGEQRRDNALPLPAVIDRKPELETRAIRMKRVAGFADKGVEAIDFYRRRRL